MQMHEEIWWIRPLLLNLMREHPHIEFMLGAKLPPFSPIL